MRRLGCCFGLWGTELISTEKYCIHWAGLIWWGMLPVYETPFRDSLVGKNKSRKVASNPPEIKHIWQDEVFFQARVRIWFFFASFLQVSEAMGLAGQLCMWQQDMWVENWQHECLLKAWSLEMPWQSGCEDEDELWFLLGGDMDIGLHIPPPRVGGCSMVPSDA